MLTPNRTTTQSDNNYIEKKKYNGIEYDEDKDCYCRSDIGYLPKTFLLQIFPLVECSICQSDDFI